MDMVFDSANRECMHSVVAHDARHIRPQLRQQLRGNQSSATFRSKHNMEVIADMRIGHVPSYRTRCFSYPFPALTCRATDSTVPAALYKCLPRCLNGLRFHRCIAKTTECS